MASNGTPTLKGDENPLDRPAKSAHQLTSSEDTGHTARLLAILAGTDEDRDRER